MTMLMGLQPTHPGELLREDIVPALGLPKTKIAAMLRISRQHFYDIMNEEKPVTPQMALRLAKLLNTTPELWTNMQASYDLATGREAIAADLELIPVLEAA